jgi:DNA-binding phage protein
VSSLTDWVDETPERQRTYEQERLIVDVAEAVQGLMNETGVKRAELARRMGTSRMSLHQMLSGQQNLTLRTMALMAHALGYRVSVKFEPYSEMETRVICTQCGGKKWFGDIPCSACNAMGESTVLNRGESL